MTPEAFETRLNGHGISSYGNVVTSAQAAATLVTAGERVYVIGEAGLIDAVSAAGAELVGGHDDGPIDAVVMGITRSFDYDMLRHATRSVLAGARLIASNTDTTFPASDGIDPGNGALVAAVETATGRRAEVAGKPHQAMAKLVASQWQGQGICVGDRPETDGDFAVELGYAFGLVFSGVTLEADLPVRPEPRIVAADLERLVESVLD